MTRLAVALLCACVSGCATNAGRDGLRELRNDVDLIDGDLRRVENELRDLRRGYRVVPVRVTITDQQLH